MSLCDGPAPYGSAEPCDTDDTNSSARDIPTIPMRFRLAGAYWNSHNELIGALALFALIGEES